MPELPFTLSGRRVWVAGHRGLVGQALMRRLAGEGCVLLTAARTELDLTRQADVEAWVADNRPDAVFVAAAKVGGIWANQALPGDFLYDNLMIQANILQAVRQAAAAKVMLIGSSAVYPRLAPQPMAPEALLTGPLEPTHEPYAVAKIAGLKLGQALRRQHGLDVISALPTNLYGPGDSFDLKTSHVLPGLIRRFSEAAAAGAPSVTLWGSGQARREFLHSDDCADALAHLMQVYSDAAPVNVGSGEDLTILELARLLAEVAGFEGEILTDPAKPDGPPRKLMSAEALKALGWAPKIALREGVERVYRWFQAHPPADAA